MKAEKLIRSALSSELSPKQPGTTEENKMKTDSPTTDSAAKKRKLADTQGEDLDSVLMTGEMLSDIHINFAQSLLKRQFPNLRGFQSTLYQQKEAQCCNSEVWNDQLQIVHSRGDHWIAASSIGCVNGGVNVYDSFYTALDETTERVLCKLFYTSTPNIKMLSMQKQVGGRDCGLFAIAVITAIANGKDPSKSV